MKMLSRHLKSMRLAAALVAVIVFAVAFAAGCSPSPIPTPVPTATPEFQGIAWQIARDIVADVGEVSNVHEGDPKKVVLVFEETHNSRAGQIEIAIMLNRLYLRQGLKHIGLEGAVTAGGTLDMSWFRPSLAANQTIGPREEVAVQLLEKGEISSAELMAFVYPDVVVHGIEKAEEYNVELPEAAAASEIIYLMAIAETSMTRDQIRKANELAAGMEAAREADKLQKVKEYIDYVIGTNRWAKEQYDKLSDPAIILSEEELVAILDAIEAKAAEVSADLRASDKENFRALKTFYETALIRSRTMVSNLLPLADKYQGTPVAVTMGAAHTAKVSQLLTASGVSYAVIKPLSLVTGDKRGDLSSVAYDRKLKGLSVGEKGSLGSLLDNRRKPPPVVGKLGFRSQADLMYLTTMIARAWDRGEPVPFNQTLSSVLPELQYVRLDTNSFIIRDGDVIFSVEAQTNDPSRTATIWVRTKRMRTGALERTPEQYLFESRDRVKEARDPSQPQLERISGDTIAVYGPTLAAVEGVKISG